MKEDAFDFILKPWDNNKPISTIHASLKLRYSKIENDSLVKTTNTLKQELKPSSEILIGQSEPMKQVMEMVKKVAVTDAKEDRIGKFEALIKAPFFWYASTGI